MPVMRVNEGTAAASDAHAPAMIRPTPVSSAYLRMVEVSLVVEPVKLEDAF
jgi:hypothetical protein